jgi:tetratricopeptide (TPR) repeat protein
MEESSMNWQQVTQSFLPLSREQTSDFAPPREIELAIVAYNRAIRNLNQDSADIALIALRKLASDYPAFMEASLLYGCCLAQTGHFTEAREQLIRTGKHTELPADIEDATKAALQAVDEDIAKQSAQIASGKTVLERIAPEQSARPAATVLEKTGRHARVRMASDRERRDVIRRGEMQQEEETHVIMGRSTIDIFRIALPVTGILVLILLVVFLVTQVLPNIRPVVKKASADERLSFLLLQIEKNAKSDAEWAAILADYKARFDPTPTPGLTMATTAATSGQTSSSTESTFESTTTASTTALTSETTPQLEPTATASVSILATTANEAILLSANSIYREAITVKDTDTVTAAEKLLLAINQLQTVPAATSVAGLTENAGALLITVKTQFDLINKTAAESLRLLAEPFFNQGQYQNALNYYLRAYNLYPASYGGGVAYYSGRCYQLLNQPAKAKPFYDYVVAAFAGKSIAASAASRLRELG